MAAKSEKSKKSSSVDSEDDDVLLEDDPHYELCSKIVNSPEYLRTKAILNEMFTDLVIKKLIEEVEQYQRERGSRKPLQLIQDPKTFLIRYASEDASYRSRVSYIQSKSRRIANKARYLLDSFHDYLTARYSSQIKGTVAVKNAVMGNLTHKLRVKLAALESLDESCSLLIEDIDQGQWQRKAIISVLDIEARPEGRV